MNFARKTVLKSMNRLVGSCSSVPSNLFKISEIEMRYGFDVKKSFFDILLDSANSIIFLRTTKVRSIVTNNHGDSAFSREFIWVLFLWRLNFLHWY
jgi:hypothetical protein